MSTSIIDDSDSQLVKYSGAGWTKGGTPNEYDTTTSSSTAAGDSFTVAFNGITGASIGVYGTIDSTSGGVVTSYSVDGAPEVQVTSPAGAGDTYHQLFWQSGNLGVANHNLVVKMIKVNPTSGTDAGEGTIWFDYFQVAAAVPTPSASGVSSTPSLSSSSSSSTRTSTTAPPSGVASKLPSLSSSRKSSIAPIVGGIVAGILLLAAMIVIFLLLRRRRRNTNSTSIRPPKPPKPEIDEGFGQTPGYMPLPNGNSQINITPSVYSSGGIQTTQFHNYQHPAPASISRSSISNSNYNAPAGQSVLYYGSEAQHSSYAGSHQPIMPAPGPAAPSTTVPSRPSISKDAKASNPSLTLAWMPDPIQHVDSGLRVVNGQQATVKPEELPPVYSAQ